MPEPGSGDHPAEAPLPEILPGGYLIRGEMHRGGQGIIYRAVQLQTKRTVAIKMLLGGTLATPRQRQRIEREAEIVAALRHPGIVTIFDAGYLDDGRFAFAMEYVRGETLDHWASAHPVTDKRAMRDRLVLFGEICDAVRFAHQHGVVHRDLKPANILIDRDGRPHILDFGIAKALEPDHDPAPGFGEMRPRADAETRNRHQTFPGEFFGTPAYASPEQVSGDPTSIDTRSDLYSLGVILYQLITGDLPYQTDGPLQEIVHRIAH